MEDILPGLKNPPSKYRPIPLWSWNDKLEPALLRQQIRQMAMAGLGGYFMHARGGLETGYLSDEWMACIEACMDEGKKVGLDSWAYDEDGFPSGFAGGAVTELGDRYHVRWLEFEELNLNTDIPQDDAVLGAYRLSGERIIVARHKSNKYYVDILNADVIKAFLGNTHEKYYRDFRDDCGTGLKGFFTDEPQYARKRLPWSYVLEDSFFERHGYNLRNVLPALVTEIRGFEKIRYDYWGTVNELFVEAYAKQVYKWCDEHNCMLAGHYVDENSLAGQMYCCAGIMPLYEFMHIPGIDWLGRRIGSPVVPKQAASVACQLRKEQVMTETFALCGWNVSFEEMKWIAEWQLVNGVNLICQHLEGYSLRGMRKRDYPPSLFYQQPWWGEYHHLNDYFARLGMLLSSGADVTEVLVLHPIKSAWIVYDNTNIEKIVKLDHDFTWVSELLSGWHINYHYGDETIIRTHGRVEKNRFFVGQRSYKAVILPSMITVDGGTLNLLKAFLDNGGAIISAGDLPYMKEGRKDPAVSDLMDRVIKAGKNEKAFRCQIEGLGVRRLYICDDKDEISDIHYQQRNLGDTQLFYMVNQSQTMAYTASVEIMGKGRAVRFNAETGEAENICFTYYEDTTVVSLDFEPMQSHTLLFIAGDTPMPVEKDCKQTVIRHRGIWNVEEMDMNSLTLDYCSFSIDNGEWQGPIPVIRLMDLLLEMKRSCDIALKYTFEMDVDPEQIRELFLVVEEAEKFNICMNGTPIDYIALGWWKDSSFLKLDIKSHVKTGLNEVVLKRCFYQKQKVYDILFGDSVHESELNRLNFDTELESIYVVGDFGVISKGCYTEGDKRALCTEGPFVITEKPSKVETGDITRQGFCFYSGSVKLSSSVEIEKQGNSRIILDFGKPDAVLTKLIINEKPVKAVLWAPYRVDITDFVVDGTNKIMLQLYGSNRNLLGPHHHVDGEIYRVGPMSFAGKRSWVDNDRREGSIWSDRYCFVRFGLTLTLQYIH